MDSKGNSSHNIFFSQTNVDKANGLTYTNYNMIRSKIVKTKPTYLNNFSLALFDYHCLTASSRDIDFKDAVAAHPVATLFLINWMPPTNTSKKPSVLPTND